MKEKSLIVLLFVFIWNVAYCQKPSADNETVPILSVKYPPLTNILKQVLLRDDGHDYSSDTLDYLLFYYDTVFDDDIYLDSSQSKLIVSGTPFFTFILSPCPDGIPAINDSLIFMIELEEHYFYLMNYQGNLCNDILYTNPTTFVARDKILLTEAMEDDRWPHYFYMSTTDVKGNMFWWEVQP